MGGEALRAWGKTHLACELRSAHPETAHGCESLGVERDEVVEVLGVYSMHVKKWP